MSDGTESTAETDPLDQIMSESGDLAEELEAMADFGDETDEAVLPEGFSLFAPKDEVIDRLRESGKSARITRLRVHPVHNGKRGPSIGNYTPEGFTLEGMRSNLPPGTYDVHGLNEDGLFVGGKRVPVNTGQTMGAPSINGNGGSGSIGDKLLYELAMKGLKGDGPQRGNEMHQAMADMVKLISVQSSLSMQQLKLQLEVSDRENKQSARSNGGTIDMLKIFLPLLTRQQASKSNGAGAGGKVEDMMGLLQFGMQLQGMINGNKQDDDQSWMKLIPQLADSLGPGAIALVAMMLPEDKAKMVSEVLEKHQQARAAEANAETSEDPPTVDTTGVPVGG